MGRSTVILALALGLVVSCGCQWAKTGRQAPPGPVEPQGAEPLQPEQFRAQAWELLYTAEPPVGYAAARHKPGQNLAVALRLNWNAAVRPLAGSFDRLHDLRDSGGIAPGEFAARHDELLAVLGDLGALKQQLDALLADYEAGLPLAEPDSPESRLSTQAVRARARELIQSAADRVARAGVPAAVGVAPELARDTQLAP